MTSRRCSPYAQRNAAPILEVLKSELAASADVLEIGSGTGQHAVFFADSLPHSKWQTSDLESNHATINAWIDDHAIDNVARPIRLDLLSEDLPPASYDAVYSANTAHIVSIEGVQRMFRVAAKVLGSGGTFLLYGPFRRSGKFNSPSNEEFDRSLRAQKATMGIRDMDDLSEIASACGLRHKSIYAMPANNNVIVWEKA